MNLSDTWNHLIAKDVLQQEKFSCAKPASLFRPDQCDPSPSLQQTAPHTGLFLIFAFDI